MSEKQSNKERIKEITAGIEKGILELFESDRYWNYLTTMSRFHRYSLNNVMLIHAQRPNATLVAGFNKWKNSFGRHIKKGEKGIQILAPTPYKIKVDKEKLDPDTKLPMLDDDGNPITEEKEVTIPMFKVVSVFDISQTDGKPLPQISFRLSGDVAQYEVFMEALRRTSQVPIEMEPMRPGMDGYFSLTKQAIFLRKGMSQVQTVCAAIHEMAHSRLHNYEKMTELADDGETVLAPAEKDRNTEEVEAESISYAVCQYFGIETADNSFGYIATWSQGKELKELRASLETINKTSSELISGIEQNFREICKERGIDISAQEEVQEKPEPNTPAPSEQSESVQDSGSPPKQTLEESLPDPCMTPHMMERYGYTDSEMLPLSKDRALELIERDITVYMLYRDNSDAMAFDAEDIVNHDGLFGITREEWNQTRDSVPKRDVHQRFMDAPGDAYAIMQLKPDASPELHFSALDKIQGTPSPETYDTIYTGTLVPEKSSAATLERLYETFNLNHPGDFTGHSLSMSDIVALKQDGVVSYHYCDTIGFKELPNFQQKNYLKEAELPTEDDRGMIGGIINNGKQPTVSELEQQAKSGRPISLMDLADAVHREKKPSVLKKLRDQPQQPQRKSKPKKVKEKEI